jgi:nitrite reductase/ring-hydroxylating ferredoxin subunit
MSWRGIIGDLQGERVIASPIYKQHFSLATGRCLEDKDQNFWFSN